MSGKLRKRERDRDNGGERKTKRTRPKDTVFDG